MSGVGKLMKQAARIQRQMEEKQAELAERVVEASSGGGAVKVALRCDGSKVDRIEIDPSALNPEDKEVLEDMIVSALNAALENGREISNEEMGALTGGVNLPGLM